MKDCDFLINAGVIITQNGNRDVLENASLAIAAGQIADIGPTAEIRQEWQARKTLEYGSRLVMPGLVNAHTHAAMTFLRGLGDDLPLMEWLQNCVFPVEARLTPEIVRLGSLLGYAEMLATGTTACIDMYIFEDAVFDAAELAGLRCIGGEAVFAFPSAACPDWRRALDATEELAVKYAGSPKLKVAVNPHSVYTTDKEILAECRKLARQRDLPIHIHLAETRSETIRCLEEHGMRPVAWCAENGLLEERLICAHLVDIEEDEAALLAASGGVGVHNPSSNMKLASGASPVGLLAGKGLTMALGTDGPASNNTLNMFAEMGRAALLHKFHEADPVALPAGHVLDMATRAGGKAFGLDGLGTLQPGAPADCIALDMTRPNMLPMHDPVSQIVYAASGHECVMTMVGGEILFEDGKFTRFDYQDLVAQAARLKKFALQKT